MLLTASDAARNCAAYFWARARRSCAWRSLCSSPALWTIPVGVLIGLRPKLSAIAQPIAQMAASVPATALFPIILLVLIRVGGGLGIGSIVLLLLGTQWYILFNVIAGRHRDSHRSERSVRCFSFRQDGTLAGTVPAGNFSVSDHGIRHGVGRRLERQHRRGIFPISRADVSDDGAGRGDQQRDGHREFRACCWRRRL